MTATRSAAAALATLVALAGVPAQADHYVANFNILPELDKQVLAGVKLRAKWKLPNTHRNVAMTYKEIKADWCVAKDSTDLSWHNYRVGDAGTFTLASWGVCATTPLALTRVVSRPGTTGSFVLPYTFTERRYVIRTVLYSEFRELFKTTEEPNIIMAKVAQVRCEWIPEPPGHGMRRECELETGDDEHWD